MRRSLPVLAALLSLAGFSKDVVAGQGDRPVPITQRASVAGSRIVGTVTDQGGAAIAGVTVLALGATLAMARSEADGTFSLPVPAGEYILRAARAGYVSTFREAVRVHSDLPVRRHITLLKGGGEGPDQLQLPEQGRVSAPDGAPVAERDGPIQPPSETTWRLRHLPRTVLRERSTAAQPESGDGPGSPALSDEGSGAVWLRAAGDLDGHVDFLTTSSRAASGAPVPFDWPRGVAYVVLGAPVGTHGDWTARTALAAGDAASWTFVGEYRARSDQRHAFRTGMSYSAQTLDPESNDHLAIAQPSDIRRVGGVYAFDRWSLTPGLEVNYGGRLDRFDYLADPNLLGGTIDLRQQVGLRTAVFVAASRQMVAPGSDQFQPPSASGPWLPPERTFSSLDPKQALLPEEVDRYQVGLQVALRDGVFDPDAQEGIVLRARRVSEDSDHQIATLFGIDEASQVAHYYVSSPGSVRLSAWSLGIAGRLSPFVQGSVDYAVVDAQWSADGRGFRLRRAARSLARRDPERGHDLTSSIRAVLPSTDTTVQLAVRLNSRFSHPDVDRPDFGGRFAIEVQQALPIRLARGGVNLVASARTLLNTVDEMGGYYDDLLTLAPPLRLTCGIQVRF